MVCVSVLNPMREQCVIVILPRSAHLLMKLHVRVNLEEAVISAAECVNVLTLSLVQLVNAGTLGVIAAVGEENVPTASMAPESVNAILPTLVIIVSARMKSASTRTIPLLGNATAMECAIPALRS